MFFLVYMHIWSFLYLCYFAGLRIRPPSLSVCKEPRVPQLHVNKMQQNLLWVWLVSENSPQINNVRIKMSEINRKPCFADQREAGATWNARGHDALPFSHATSASNPTRANVWKNWKVSLFLQLLLLWAFLSFLGFACMCISRCVCLRVCVDLTRGSILVLKTGKGVVPSLRPPHPALKNQPATFQHNCFGNSHRKGPIDLFIMPQHMETTHSTHKHSKLPMAVKCHALQVGNEVGSQRRRLGNVHSDWRWRKLD